MAATSLWKAWRDPASEYPAPYVLTVLSMLVTLLALDRLTVLAWAFPFWILTVNALVLVVSSRRPGDSVTSGVPHRGHGSGRFRVGRELPRAGFVRTARAAAARSAAATRCAAEARPADAGPLIRGGPFGVLRRRGSGDVRSR